MTYAHGNELIHNAPGTAGEAARAWWGIIDGAGTVLVGLPFSFGTMAVLHGWQVASRRRLVVGMLLTAVPLCTWGTVFGELAAAGQAPSPVLYVMVILVLMVCAPCVYR